MSLTRRDVEQEQWLDSLSHEERRLLDEYDAWLNGGIERVDPELVQRYQELVDR